MNNPEDDPFKGLFPINEPKPIEISITREYFRDRFAKVLSDRLSMYTDEEQIEIIEDLMNCFDEEENAS